MSSSSDGPSEGDREETPRSGWSRFGSLPIWARLALLTAAGLISLIGSSLFLSSALNQTAERTTQMQGLHDAAAAAAEAHVTFGELRYWLTDLSVSLLVTSERSADAARARLEPQLDHLADARPEEIARIRAEVDAYVSKAIEAADAYADGNRVIGNTLLAQARGHSTAVDAALDGLVGEFHAAAVAERERVVARAEDSANTALMIVAVLTLVGLGLTGIVFRSIVQPLRRLNAAVAGFARGRYDVELPADGDHEFGAMARTLRAFRENAIERERLEAEAERQHNMVATAIETISDGFVLYDEDTRVRLANSKYREMLGEIAPIVQPGVELSEILAAQAKSNLAQLEGQPVEEWVEERVARHRDVPQSVDERTFGDTWVRISKRDTPDGGKVAVYTDITEIKHREEEALAARQRFEEAIEAISSGFALFDADDRLVIWNSRFRDYFARMADVFVPGTTFREMLAASIERGLLPAAEGNKEEFLESLLAERARGIGKVRENRLSDGLWLQIRDHRTKDGGLVSIYTDVSELKTSEQQAQAARQRFEEAIEAISSGFALFDAEDRLVLWNSRFRDYFSEVSDVFTPGVPFRDMLAATIKRGLFPGAKEDPEGFLDALLEKRAKGVGQIRENILSDGLWLQIRDHRTKDGGMVSIYTDVTELKTSEQEIRKQSAILEATLENMGQGITMVDKDLKTVAFNRKFFELMDWPEERFKLGFTMEEAFRYNAERGEYGPGDVEEQVRERVELAKKFLPHKFERARPDGTILEIVGNPIEGGGLVATYTDITERKQAEEALKAALEEFDAVIDSIDYGVLFMGPDLRARIINRAFGEIWGISQEFIDQRPTMRELIEYNRNTGVYDVTPEDWDAWIDDRVKQITKGDIPPGDFHRADGKVLSYQCIALPDGGRMLTYFDITELKNREAEITKARDEAEAALAGLRKAQQRLIQAEKMASLGQLTAGIAHEIKNPLNFVNNFAKLSDELLDELSDTLEAPIKSLDDETRDDAEDLLRTVRENMGKINEHGKRADSIVKNMLLHSREGPSERQPARINAIAEEALNLAYHGARAENPKFNIEMAKKLNANPDEVVCFPQDLMRVFLNLITNGMYAANKRAIEEGNGFSPTIAVSSRNLDDAVEIEVRDNGRGIDPEMRDRIFMPFFTTKPAGEGTGLGLSLSYDIVVKQHGGELSVDSEPGSHTAFRVTLPQGATA
ncbi:MAG: PAS-domain containing protein [Paracoccaceae bacterium]|nr:PAS-domain containing protein [Paracoccaceae bacterium]